MRSAYMGALRIERRTFRKTVSKIFRDFSLLLSQLSYAPFMGSYSLRLFCLKGSKHSSKKTDEALALWRIAGSQLWL